MLSDKNNEEEEVGVNLKFEIDTLESEIEEL